MSKAKKDVVRYQVLRDCYKVTVPGHSPRFVKPSDGKLTEKGALAAARWVVGQVGKQAAITRRKPLPVSPAKARKILHDRQVGGRKLTEAQRRFFGAAAGGRRANVDARGGRRANPTWTGRVPRGHEIIWAPVNQAWFVTYPASAPVERRMVVKIGDTAAVNAWIDENWGHQFKKNPRGKAKETQKEYKHPNQWYIWEKLSASQGRHPRGPEGTVFQTGAILHGGPAKKALKTWVGRNKLGYGQDYVANPLDNPSTQWRVGDVVTVARMVQARPAGPVIVDGKGIHQPAAPALQIGAPAVVERVVHWGRSGREVRTPVKGGETRILVRGGPGWPSQGHLYWLYEGNVAKSNPLTKDEIREGADYSVGLLRHAKKFTKGTSDRAFRLGQADGFAHAVDGFAPAGVGIESKMILHRVRDRAAIEETRSYLHGQHGSLKGARGKLGPRERRNSLDSHRPGCRCWYHKKGGSL